MPNKNSESKNITWEAYEFKPHTKPAYWYIIFAVVSAALLLYAIIYSGVITTITFALLIATSYFFSIKQPKKAAYAISPEGIYIGKSVYPYKNIKAFWIVYRPPEVKTLNFETTAYLNRLMKIELADVDPMEVKMMLAQYIPEDLEREESLTDVITRKLKF